MDTLVMKELVKGNAVRMVENALIEAGLNYPVELIEAYSDGKREAAIKVTYGEGTFDVRIVTLNDDFTVDAFIRFFK